MTRLLPRIPRSGSLLCGAGPLLLLLAAFAFAGRPTAARAAAPAPPDSLRLEVQWPYVILTWLDPTRHADGSAMFDFGGLHVYRDDALIATVRRGSAFLGQKDAWSDLLPPPGPHSYYLTAIDTALPPAESAPTAVVRAPTGALLRIDSPIDLQAHFDLSRQTVLVHNDGLAPLDYRVSNQLGWIRAAPVRGSVAPSGLDTLALTLDARFVPVGAYRDTLVVTSNDPDHPRTLVPVTILQGSPELSARLDVLDERLVLGGLPPHDAVGRLRLSNTGTVDLAVRVAGGPQWLSQPPITMVAPGRTAAVAFQAATTGLPIGTVLRDTLLLEINRGDEPFVRVPMELRVGPGHVRAVPESLTVRVTLARDTLATFELLNDGAAPIVAVPYFMPGWLSESLPVVSLEAGRSQTVAIMAHTDYLFNGPLTDQVIYSFTGNEQPRLTIPLKFDIQIPGPRLRVEPDSLEIFLQTGGSTTVSLNLHNDGGRVVRTGLTFGASWLSTLETGPFDVAGGSTRTVKLQVRAGTLTYGNYRQTLNVTSDDPDHRSIAVPVILRVGLMPKASLSPARLDASVRVGVTAAPRLTLRNDGQQPLRYSFTGAAAWLTPRGGSGELLGFASTVLSFTLSSAGLPPGTYADTLQLHTNDPDRTEIAVPVVFQVTAIPRPSLGLSLTKITLAELRWLPRAQVLYLADNGDFPLPLHFRITHRPVWLITSADSGVVNYPTWYKLDLRFDATVPAGAYDDSLVIDSDAVDTPHAVLPAHFVLMDEFLEFDPSPLRIEMFHGGPDAQGVLQVRNLLSNGILLQTQGTTRPGVTVTPFNGPVPAGGSAALTVTVRTGALPIGIHLASLNFNAYPDSLTPLARAAPMHILVKPSPPMFTAWTPRLDFEAPEGAGSDTTQILFENPGELPLGVHVVATPPWLRAVADPDSVPGSGSGALPLVFDPGDWAAGDYLGQVVLASNGRGQPRVEIPVTLRVNPPRESIAPTGVRISSFLTGGWTAAPSLQYIELEAMPGADVYRPRLGLRLTNARGEMTWESTEIFPEALRTAPWSSGSHWLLGTPAVGEQGGPSPDTVMPARLDPRGGTITLFATGTPEEVLQRVSYGVVGSEPAPTAGACLVLDGQGVGRPSIDPAPRNGGGQAGRLVCPCPEDSASVCGTTSVSNTPAAHLQGACGYQSSGEITYDLPAGRQQLLVGNAGTVTVVTRDPLVLDSRPAGFPFPIRVGLVASQTVTGSGGGGARSSVTLERDGVSLVVLPTASSSAVYSRTDSSFAGLTLDPGAPLVLAHRLTATATGGYPPFYGGYAKVTSQLAVAGVSAGARLRSCQGRTVGRGALRPLALWARRITAAGVELVWRVPDETLSATVALRSGGETNWRELGPALMGPAGQAHFRLASAEEGAHVRLTLDSGRTSVIPVETFTPPPPPTFRLLSAGWVGESVLLRWHVETTEPAVTLERRAENETAWRALRQVVVPAAQLVMVADDEVDRTLAYAYRLRAAGVASDSVLVLPPLPPPPPIFLLLSAGWVGESVLLRWHVETTEPAVTLERRADNEAAWRALRQVGVTAAQLVEVEDDAVERARAYAYRLRAAGVASDSVLVLPPPPPGPLTLALRPMQTRSDAHPQVVLTLVADTAARLEAYAVGGRLLESITIDDASPGDRVLALGRTAPYPSGIVFLRLSQGGVTARGRLVVVR